MKPTARSLLAALMALVIFATGGAMAVARGQTHVAGSIVLCTGTGPVSVPVDAEGRPVGPVHICPDCALALFAFDIAAPVASVRDAAAAQLAHTVTPVTGVSRVITARKARAPPAA